MPKQGEISVWMTVAAAGAAHHWLLSVYLPAAARARHELLGRVDLREESLRRLRTLAEQLGKCARRKSNQSKERFTTNIRRDAAVLYVGAIDEFDPLRGFPSIMGRSLVRQVAGEGTVFFLTWEAGAWIRTSLAARACRPTLSAAKRKVRLAPQYAYDKRNRKRLKLAVKRDEAWDQFFRSGGSLLGSSVPLPEI